MEKIENYDAHKVEQEILEFWKKHDTYAQIKQKSFGKTKFYYLDGPPYTSGKIHIGHAWGKSLRDAAMRYKRAAGFDVWDRSGFDMHGLPISHKVEAKLGIKGKDAIDAYGVDKFIEECKKLELENMRTMIVDFKRLGVWMDFDNPYKPIDNSYIEGIWWLIKKAHENSRLYEGFRTLTWCASCETANAKHELEYKTVTDKSIFVKFRLKDKPDEYLIIWTTTPWTIPFNLAVMVNPDIDYVKAEVDGETWIVAKALANQIGGIVGKKFEIIDEFKGEKLEGLGYIHPFHKYIDFPKSKKLHTVILSKEYVDISAGSGLVHCAPGCGPEDYEVGHKNGLLAFNKLTEQGVFFDMGKFSGLKAKADDKKFVEALEQEDAIVAQTSVEHEYPHCWRCHSPVVFRATKQWFFKVEDLKEEMKNLNKSIQWVPDWAGNRQFHSWLDNLRDNSITKQIHWGTPFPVWKCESCERYTVIGSAKELKELAGEVPDDLHKPYIDKVTIKCECGGVQKKNPDVLDVWVDAGCASWLCLDYPVRTDLFEKLFPADFILEGKDQIRGWFNLLFVASMVSMNRPSFNACYMHGFINDSLGRKMSKSLGNVISPYEVIEKYGADTLRYYMIGAANPGIDMNYNFEDMKLKNKNLVILWNLHKYLIDSSLLAETNPAKINASEVKLDTEERYILSKLNSTIQKLTAAFDDYKLSETPSIVEELFLELSRTYIQLVREKLASGDDDEKASVLYTMYHVLIESIKMFAPIAPFISEKIYHNLRHAFNLKEEGVSELSWPKADKKAIGEQLEKDFQTAKEAIQAILNAREKAALGVRWPLKEIIIKTAEEDVKNAVEHLKESIMTQTNAKKISVVTEFKGVEHRIKPNYKSMGPAFGPLAPKIIDVLAAEDHSKIIMHIEKGGYKIPVEGTEVLIQKDHLVIETVVADAFRHTEFKGGDVFIDITRTPQLDAEGYFREVSRRVQNMRKNAGLHKADRIKAHVTGSISIVQDLKLFEKELKEKIGAVELSIDTKEPKESYEHSANDSVKKEELKIAFSKI